MSNKSALKQTIDKMVREAIREILPEVMNEVLLRTIANSGTIQEQKRPVQQRNARSAQRQAPQSQVNQRQQQLAGINRGMSLREALNPEEAGLDYYEQAERAIEARQPRQPQRQVQRPQPIVEQQYDENEMYGEDEIFDFNDEPPPPQRQQPPSRAAVREQVAAQRIADLPPAIQSLAEDTFRLVGDDEFEDDGGGEWGANEFAPMGNSGQNARAPNINIDRAADVLGLDFSRFAQTVAVTEGTNKPKITQQDVMNEAQWKMAQLERQRKLLDSKKVG